MSAGPFIAPFPMADSPPSRATVTVVGASLAGVAAALFLAREGVDVTVLEAGATIAGGQTGRDLGLVEWGVVEHPHRTLRALGKRSRHLIEWTNRGKDLLREEGLMHPSGLTWIASRPDEVPALEASHDALTAAGVHCELHDADTIAARTGTHGLFTGLFLPEEGWIEPWQACATLASRLVEAGGTLIGHAPVQAVDDSGEELLVKTPEFTLPTDVVILAAGHGSAALDDALAGRLLSVREQLLCTSPTERSFPGVHRAGQGWMRWMQTEDGRVVLGGARWASPHLATGETSLDVDEPVQRKLDAFLHAHFALDSVEQRWASCFATTPDGLPILGRLPGDGRRVVLAGFGPSPVSLSLAAARSVATGLLEGEVDIPRLFSARRIVRWRRE